jgi:uncharacterized membrane protein YeaQ/YmgE (transglycosylase-associated protein family)
MSNLSPAPGTPQTSTKAVVSAVGAFVGTFIFGLWQALADRTDLDSMTNTQWLIVVLGALATSFATGGFTYATQNKPKAY